jgi:hypothetical protein
MARRVFRWERQPITGRTVMRYIANQKEHHKKMDSATEYALFLKKHGFEVVD